MTMNKSKYDFQFRPPIFSPEERGATAPVYRKKTADDIIIETDIPVTMRDGVKIYIDVFRPLKGKCAPLIAWGPYGKHGHTKYSVNFPAAEVDDSKMSDYTAFEAPDPFYWAKHGYAVINANPRGTWYSEGRATYLSPEEALDFYDLIEWAGVQDWSNGKVGLSGVSYLSSAQWRVAELNPPHLAAINPWEGWSDTYREVVRHGGIPETSFWDYLPGRWGHSVTEVEDLRKETAQRPFLDDYWESKKARLERIKVPAFVCASWTDQALHTRGTLEGFRKITSDQKWLYVHGRKKWAHYYDHRSVEMQRAFFDHFLWGKESDLQNWPRVRYEARSAYYEGVELPAQEWPIDNTDYQSLYLSPNTLQRTLETTSEVSYNTNKSDDVHFDFTFKEPTMLVGHAQLQLWVSIDQGVDMDIFVALQKLDQNGKIVPFAHYAQFDDGPVALGWLRASHRELDLDESTEFIPVLKHARELPLTTKTPTEVNIEIWPSGTTFEKGETLRLVVKGEDIYKYPKPSIFARHEDLRNVGTQRVHLGQDFPSRLLIPVVKSAPA